MQTSLKPFTHNVMLCNLVVSVAEQVNVRPVADCRILAHMDCGVGQAVGEFVLLSVNGMKCKVHAFGQYHGNVHKIQELSLTWL